MGGQRQNQSAASEPPPDLVELASGDMIVTFDRARGVLYAIKSKSDPLSTNFIGNPQNVRRVPESSCFGDLITTVWHVTDPAKLITDVNGGSYQTSGHWQSETTGGSGDTRRVTFDGTTFRVAYTGKSKNDGGVQSYDLAMSYAFAQEGVLIWDLSLRNTTPLLLEIGELAFPFLINDDYASLSAGENPADRYKDPAAKQRGIHEQKVFSHNYIGGHSSYSLIERPMGVAPFLLVQPQDDTWFECMYKQVGRTGRPGGGPDLLAVHSQAQRQLQRWVVPWVNNHSSVVLQPGEERKYRLSFKFIQDYPQIRDEVAASGNVGIRIVPAMVVQEGVATYVELKSQAPIDHISAESDGITFESRKRVADKELLTLSFQGWGQKTVRMQYGAGRWTNMHFFCVQDIASLLKTRSKFVIERQWIENPDDPFHRNHMFLPFDYGRKTTFTDSEEAWEVGGSNEFGFSEAVFLSEKNVFYPSREEIAKLETYVSDCLFKYIQDPETYKVRASLYWKVRTPSSPRGHWNEARSHYTVRTYDYAHPTNIYHALYRIGKQYGLLTQRQPLDYLRMSYRTALVWFVTGNWQHIGIMCGSNAVNLLEDLKKEGMMEEYAKLRAEMVDCDKVMVEDPYPYSSELTIDQTAHEQVYFFTKYFGNTEKQMKTLRVIKALRGGNEPLWFRYGQDRRNFWSCWYSESLNGMALLDGFEETGDPDMFIKGFAGVMSVAANLTPDGMCFSQFVWSPGVFTYQPPTTREGGQGQWGFLKSARAFVLRDEAFGLIGAGCAVEESGDQIRVTPKDGLRKTVVYPEKKLRVSLTQGEIDSLVFHGSGAGGSGVAGIELAVVDTTGIVEDAALSIQGLAPGSYRVHYGGKKRTESVTGNLDLTMPMKQAQSIRIERT